MYVVVLKCLLCVFAIKNIVWALDVNDIHDKMFNCSSWSTYIFDGPFLATCHATDGSINYTVSLNNVTGEIPIHIIRIINHIAGVVY